MFLIGFNNQSHYYDNGWLSVGSLPPEENDFTAAGMEALENIPSSAWQEIQTDCIIYNLSNSNSTSLNISYETIELPGDEEVTETYTVAYQEKVLTNPNPSLMLEVSQQQLSYPEEVDTTLDVETFGSLYDESSSMYTGQGILDTEAEDIAGATTLWVTAESEKCSFQYSLDGGTSWYTVTIGEMMDITHSPERNLIVRVHLEEDDSTLTALSYAWA